MQSIQHVRRCHASSVWSVILELKCSKLIPLQNASVLPFRKEEPHSSLIRFLTSANERQHVPETKPRVSLA